MSTRPPLAPLALLALILPACETENSGGYNPDYPEESDVDADSDGDTDGDSDADSDSDTDTDWQVDVDCDEPPAPEDIGGPDCVTDELRCDETHYATTEGGENNFTGDEYSSFWACAVVGTESYTGGERVYEFQHPGTGDVTIGLSSPCGDLDLFAIFWEGDTCPSPDGAVSECEGSHDQGDDSFVIWNNEPRRYLVVVEGENGEELPFALTAVCP